MPMINGIEYIDNPEVNSELISEIINLPISGRRKLNPTDTKKKRITRKDVARMARDMANSEDAQQYLSGQVSLGGNKSRQKLFDQSFKSEIERQKQEELLRQIGLGGEEVTVAPGIKGDDAYKIATSFRNRPITGHIGAGLDQNLGDKDLLRIATAGIGLPLLAANPVTGALIEPLAKPAVHTAKVLLDPTKAITGVGQAAAATADAYGAYESLKANSHLMNNWANGQFHHSDIPKFALNTLGVIPGVKYFSDFVPAFGKALTWAADDVARSYNNMVNGVEPVYGIRAGTPAETLLRASNEGSANVLPNPPSGTTNVRNLNIAPRPQQYANLSQDVVHQLNRIGLGRYDIQGLLDRGFSVEDMLRLSDTNTPGYTSNRRAQILGQRLMDSGISPTQPTRLAYLQSIIDNGGTLLEHRGVPHTLDEWRALPETAGLDPFEHQWNGGTQWIRDIFYGPPTGQSSQVARLTSAENDALTMFESLDSFSDLRNKLLNNIEVFGEDEFKLVQPEIKRILVDGINSQKPIAQIESELDALYESYNKPFNLDLSPIHKGGATASIESPSTYNLRTALVDGIRGGRGNSAIRRNEYPSASDMPYLIKPEDAVYSPSSFSIFGATSGDVTSMQRAVLNRLPHGGITYDVHKSMQSLPMADRMYARMITDGKGIGTFLPSGYNWDNHYGDGYRRISQYLPDDGYYYRKSNDFAGTTWHPRPGVSDEYTPGINAQTARELLDENVSRFEDFLNSVDPRVFSEMGGYPKYGIEVDGTFYDLPIAEGIRADGTKGLVIQQSDDLTKAISNFDDTNESIIRTADSWNEFKNKTQHLIEGFHPDGAMAKLIQNERGVWGILDKNGQFTSLSAFAKSNPNFARKYLPYVQELNNKLLGKHLTGNQRTALMGDAFGKVERVFMHGPVRALRRRKHGGKIINNLNPTIKQLLNI